MLRVPVRGEGGLGGAALGHRQPAHEVGEPRVRGPLELGVVEQEMVDVPALVDDPQVVRLVGGQVMEDHEVRHHDLIHPAGGVEHVQVVLAAFSGLMCALSLASQRDAGWTRSPCSWSTWVTGC